MNFSTRVGAQHSGLAFKALNFWGSWVPSKPGSIGNGHSDIWTSLGAAVAFPLSHTTSGQVPHSCPAVLSLLLLSAKLNPSVSSRNQMFSLIFWMGVFKYSPLYRKGKLQSYCCVSGEKFTSLNSYVANGMDALLSSPALREGTPVQNPSLILPYVFPAQLALSSYSKNFASPSRN